MQNHGLTKYGLVLESPVAHSFRCTKAANSLDIDMYKKSKHEFTVNADITGDDYNVGLIVGASGSGKTTFAEHVYGKGCFRKYLAMDLPVIDQFPKDLSYAGCSSMLSGVGLTSVPCWIRPAHTLSNGQAARAEIALQMAHAFFEDGPVTIDEWTSVVDRTVAKVMSHSIQKFARKLGKRVVLVSCHYDVLDWLNPDWVIDCNKQSYHDRRSLQQGFKRSEELVFDVREVDRDTWKYFSKYHYLSDKLPGGIIKTFGLFHGEDQIGFQCFANYTPHNKKAGHKMQMHSNRAVIHPDYAGMGLGILMINEVAEIMAQAGYDVRAKSSSVPIYKSRLKHPDKWVLVNVLRATKVEDAGGGRREDGKGISINHARTDVKTYSFRYIPEADRK